MAAADDAREALRVARAALATAEAAARAAGVETHSQELTVERIRVVDPDGTLRLLLGNRHVGDDIPMRGRSVPHPGRGEHAGLIFVNDEGTECGGLIWSGTAQDAGAMLSLDSFEQDQAVTVLHADEGGVRRSVIEFVDRPSTSLVEGMLSGNVGNESGEGPVCRMRLAKEADGSVGLAFSDQQGRVRLRLGLDEHGKPSVELFGPNGGPAGALGR